MVETKILGMLPLTIDMRKFKPDKKCSMCPFLFDFWCNYLKVRIPDPEYFPDCPVTEIKVEEL